jgi:hypothetical protein
MNRRIAATPWGCPDPVCGLKNAELSAIATRPAFPPMLHKKDGKMARNLCQY